MTSFIAACLQMRSGRDPAANRDTAVRMAFEAADQGATYIQTPEMTSIIERDRAGLFQKVVSEDDDITLAALRETARKRGILIHIGSLAVKSDDRIANRGFLIDGQGDIAARYDKIHLFDVDLAGESWRESATYRGGHEAVVASTALGAFGLGICYDLRFPALYRALAEAGASFLTAPSCFTKQTGEAHWHVLQRARAIETGSYMISAAQGGIHEDGRETYGHSLIVDPWGRILAEGGSEPGLVFAAIDPALVEETRKRIPALRHARAFHVKASDR